MVSLLMVYKNCNCQNFFLSVFKICHVHVQFAAIQNIYVKLHKVNINSAPVSISTSVLQSQTVEIKIETIFFKRELQYNIYSEVISLENMKI